MPVPMPVSTTASQNCNAPGRNSVDGIAWPADGNGVGGVVNELSTFARAVIRTVSTHFAVANFTLLKEIHQ
jgi:hypothetical protein